MGETEKQASVTPNRSGIQQHRLFQNYFSALNSDTLKGSDDDDQNHERQDQSRPKRPQATPDAGNSDPRCREPKAPLTASNDGPTKNKGNHADDGKA